MRILYVGMKYDYGVESRGLSFEQVNFHSTLEAMGHEVTQFDFMARKKEVGVRSMRAELVEAARATDPDLVFYFLFEDEIDGNTVRSVRKASQAPALNWFADDHWRFERFSRRIAGEFDFPVTTDPDAIPKYHAAGITDIILSQWGLNQREYSPSGCAASLGVTFVGQPHANRRRVIRTLLREGVDVECWGHGWQSGRLPHDEMVRVFEGSAINLNLSAASAGARGLDRVRALVGGSFNERPLQIKGRTFEIPGCRGFQLTQRVPHLENYFEIGTEIATYDDESEILDCVSYWLANPEKREQVAEAGYRRAISDHTYDQRFTEIFEKVGLLPTPSEP